MPVTGLTGQRKHEGRRLIELLGARGVEVYAAFWAYRESTAEWRLVLVTPEAERRGPRFVLRAVDDELSKANGHTSFDLFDMK
jgi:hypothetical protein